MRFFVAFVLLLCASTALGTVTILKGQFTETKASDPHAYVNGTFYYLFDDENATKCRLRFEYNLPGNVLVSNLYDYDVGAMYSMCPGSCTADTKSELPDKWWYDSSVYTKSSEQEGGKYWYNRKATNFTQVKRILMTEATTPSSNSFSKIEFQDGRIISVRGVQVNPADVPATSAKFKTDAGLSCPVPTCSMFADIVFVLDFSGSVGSTGWRQTIDFVIGVMQSFKFGDSDAAAAIVKFTYYASVVAAGTNNANGQSTVTTNLENLISAINVTLYPTSTTCMGTGLELAMKMFDNSPRRLYGNKPQNIVIAVTDGMDNDCGSGYYYDDFQRTKNAAEKLKNDYDAFFMSVGVGLTSSYYSSYVDKLKGIASDMGGIKAYFDVANYSVIKDTVDEIFSPLCEQFHTECGLDCHGFCGCGECMCPQCESTGGKCEDYKCVARAGTSDGCVMTPLLECDPGDKCVTHVCDASSGTAQCEEVRTCQEYEDKNPGTCRSVTCDVNNGKCTVVRDHSICKQFNNLCDEWECAGENETATDLTTGCKIKVNGTEKCQGPASCLQYSCNMSDGKCIQQDKCTANNHECSTFKCEGSGSNYRCNAYPIAGPENTSCTTYKCDPLTGWYVSNQVTPEDCKNDTDVCKLFRCDDDIGCTYSVVEDCGPKCNQLASTCTQNATIHSTVDTCILGACKVRPVPGSSDTEAKCEYSVTNCLTSSVMDDARRKNQDNPSVCYTPECANGGCRLKSLDKPVGEGKGDTACWINVCVEDTVNGGFKWDRQPTQVNLTCKSDNCYKWECDDVEGCVPTDICGVKSNECKTYSCVTGDDGSKECVPQDNPLADTECMYEECPVDTKIRITKNLTLVCPNPDKCKVPVCSESGQCTFKDATPPEGMFTDDEIDCAVCDPNTGLWSFGCDDGLFCTNDICGVGGRCRHTDVNCFKILNMSADSDKDKCFYAVCSEGSDKYQCKRKKKNGVYVDVCGNCIRQDGYEGSSEESVGDTVACVDAPEEPVLKEPLAAAAIAMIVLLAVLVGGVIAASTIIGTKTLLERARAANNQSAHTNPLFEDNTKEMANATYMEEVDVEAA